MNPREAAPRVDPTPERRGESGGSVVADPGVARQVEVGNTGTIGFERLGDCGCAPGTQEATTEVERLQRRVGLQAVSEALCSTVTHSTGHEVKRGQLGIV